MQDLAFVRALFGGALIGLSASLLLWLSGRIAGVSGIAAGAMTGQRGDRLWRVLFLAGLIGAGVFAARAWPGAIVASPRSIPMLAIAGLAVGIGTRLGNGCTSGHGVCGISRLSTRSIVATVVFMAAGMLTVTLVRMLGGGAS